MAGRSILHVVGLPKHVTRSARNRWRAALKCIVEPIEARVLLSTTTIDHSSGFASATDMQLNGVAIVTGATDTPPNALRLTDGMNGEASSAFNTTAQGIDTFDTTYTFTYGSAVPPNADGMAFVIQSNDPTAIGGGYDGLGYEGMANSVAVKFDLWDRSGGSPTNNESGVFIAGVESDNPRQGVDPTTVAPTNTSIVLKTDSKGNATGIDFHANPSDTYQVHLVYDGTILTETVTDMTKSVSVSQKYDVNVPAAVNGHTAFAGFTGGTGGLNSEQDILTWKFSGQNNGGAVTLPAPILSASPCNPGEIDLGWNNVTRQESGFELDQSSDGGATFTPIATAATLPTGTNTYSVTGLDVTKTYEFRIKAVGNGTLSDSPFSNVVSASGAGLPASGIDHSAGFAGATDMKLNNGATITPGGLLQLTDGHNYEGRSAFSTSAQLIQKFDTTFDFGFGTTTPPNDDGFAFVIQNGILNGWGPGALGGALGYQGIPNSIVVKFELYDTTAGTPTNNQTGVFDGATAADDPRQGVDPTTPAMINTPIDLKTDTKGNLTGIDFHANPTDIYEVHLVYDGTTLTETVTDKTSGKSTSQAYTVDIPTTIGGSDCALVGFTAATGGMNAEQDILSWKFTGANGSMGGNQDVINDSAGGQTITLKQDATNHAQIDWTLGAQSGKLPITDANGLTINDTAARDTIVLDNSNGNPLPNLLKLNGPFAVNGFQSLGTGQKVDIGSSHVQVNYSGASLLGAIRGYLAGGQIISSAIAANPKLAVADLDNGSAILLQQAVIGDANLSGKVDFTDFVTLARNYGKTNADWSMGDFNYDGKVDFGDLVALARNYNQGGPTVASALSPGVSTDTGTLQKQSRRPLATRI